MWFARLSDELLDMVDAKKIGISQGADIYRLLGSYEWEGKIDLLGIVIVTL